MNVLLGLLLLFLLYGTADGVVVPKVATVEAGSAAELAGITAGDEIISLNGRRIHISGDLYWEKSQLTGEETEIVVRRNGEKQALMFTPQMQEGEAVLGIRLLQSENNLWLTLKTGFYSTVFYARVVVDTFLDLIRGRVAFTNLSGPVGIVSEIGSAVQETAKTGWSGFLNLLQLTVLLTINLGVFNLLPIPALDGGRIFFVLIEMIRRKPLSPEKEGMVHMIGFAFLILLSVVIAYMDVLKLFS